TLKVPRLGDSITEGVINEWKKKVGDYVYSDETLAVIDTDKVSVDINSKTSGALHKIFAEAGDVVLVDSPLCEIDTSAQPNENDIRKNTEVDHENKLEVNDEIEHTNNDEDIKIKETNVDTKNKNENNFAGSSSYQYNNERTEKRIRMLPMRKRIAERLKESQNTCALLTTFNECDMSKAIVLRTELKDIFQKKYGCKLGFVSLFLYASTLALKKMPQVNAYIDNDEIVYKNYIDISVAVATPNGLTVPVIRDCQNKNLPQLELALSDLAAKAKNNKLSLDEFTG
ncbi:dihydrolipoyllysine-residue succinyltransferase component of 2-oxoglutarate dehydrogenase complex, putative, partial [Plasmodium ovale curtisi]